MRFLKKCLEDITIIIIGKVDHVYFHAKVIFE